MPAIMKQILLLITLTTLASGCARRDGFPSLAPRAAELAANAPAVLPAPPVLLPSDADRRKRLADAVQLAENSQGAFDAALAKARSAVSSAGNKGSDSWIAAQLAVSRLEATRGETGTALALIDRERVALFAGGASVDEAALNAAHDQALEIDQAQEQAVRGLSRRLGGY
jgi:hypothetical protein